MENRNIKCVLVGSPLHQKPSILNKFLTSLKGLKQDQIELEFLFIDDNKDQRSSQLLINFKEDMNELFNLYTVWRWYDKLDTKLREKGDSVYG